jgi:hypothetical protein
VSSYEKKTRRTESNQDLQAFLSGLAFTGAALENFVFDNVDVPEVINYMATMAVTQDIDGTDKNHFLHRDTEASQEWRLLPWDIDLTFGPDALNTDTIVYQLQNVAGPACASHPFIGARPYLLQAGKYQRLIESMVNTPRTRAMILRRTRTLTEQFLSTTWFQDRIEQLYPLLNADVTADHARWGGNAHFGGATYALRAALDRIKNEYLAPRPGYLLGTNIVGVGFSNAVKQPFNVAIEVVGGDFNPAGGNQEQEYVCISNTSPFAIDITGWKLEGGINFTFAPGTVLPANGVAYVSPDTRAFRARTTGPRGGEGLFVLGPYQGQLSARGETLTVKNALGLTLNTYTYAGAPSPAQEFLRITEIMYHPSLLAGNTNSPDEFEYIELRNISATTTLSLTGVRLVNGVEFNFSGSAVTSLAPGARVLVVKNAVAFAARYGAGPPMAGQFTGNLDNDGERLQLLDSTGEEILDFSYDDDWYPITDGLGFSLVVVDEAAEPDAWDQKSQWRVSGALSGSPGSAEPAPPTIAPVLITEALTRTDVPPPLDTIELHNPTALPADISGWWLTDDFNTPAKFRIPNGTVIASNDYVTFDESQFNPGGAGFALSSDGDEVWLFSADAAGHLTGYVHGYTFGAADDGVSFGRHVTSEGREHFVAQAFRSLGSNNIGPRVGPVVVSEIMYRPRDLNGTNDNRDDEYIELLNTTIDPVPLFDPNFPANVWRLRGGVDFDFPANLTLAGGEFILLVSFDPTNAAMVAAFRTKYGVTPAVRLFGPYSGQLDNSGDDVELKKPTTPVLGIVPYVLMDKVDYRDSAPWPSGADGHGLSLQRFDVSAYGNEPTNWVAVGPSAARPYIPGGIPPSITSQPGNAAGVAGRSLSLSVSVAGTAPFSYQWSFNGTDLSDNDPNVLSGAYGPVLSFPALQANQAGTYSVIILNSAGSVQSSNVQLFVMFPPGISQQPADQRVNEGSDATFSVFGNSDAPPLRYQWRRNGAPIANATSSSFTLTNVISDVDDAIYSVILTDGLGTITSLDARLTVLLAPRLIHPVPRLNLTAVPGDTLTVGAQLRGTKPIWIQWRKFNSAGGSQGIVKSGFVNTNQDFLVIPNLSTNSAVANSAGILTIQFTNSVGGSLGTTSTNHVAFLTVLLDSNANGIPDNWESDYFGSPTGADRDADSDGDGMSNRAEYLAGTNPTNAASYLKIEQGPGAATVSVATVSNRTYTVQFTDRAGSGVWSRLGDIVARSNSRVETFADPNWTTNRFYRVVLPRQP